MSSESSKTGQARTGSSTGINLGVVSILVGLLAIRSVPWGDLFFSVFASVFCYMMSRVAFPSLGRKPVVGGSRFAGAQYLPKYVMFAGIIGLFLPSLQIIFSYLRDDQVTVRESAPHLFLLAAQVVTEIVTSKRASNLPPIKAMVPVLYNARRLVNLHTWALAVFSRDLSSGVSYAATAWGLFGRSLVVSNVVIWNFNLWCFLLPVYAPWALRTYYTGVNTPKNTPVE